MLNRKEAYELLNWMMKAEMSQTYSVEKQEELFLQIKNVMLMDDKCSIVNKFNDKLLIEYQGKRKSILVIPAMYNKNFFDKGEGDVVISDKMIKCSLPKAYEYVSKQ